MLKFGFQKWNTLLSWVVFIIALFTFGSTIEPTVSFWDAGEYILTSAKLQVGHPPGAPFYQMMGAFFSLFALENTQIGMLLNFLSATASAFTILFMFWTLSRLLVKLAHYDKAEGLNSKAIAILSSAVIGSLAFTFTDSFWFNAVETEVYATATLIMAVMFYLALRWEEDMHTPRGNKWLILIAFITGLSFGVHFMGLLSIPSIGLIYFFKNYKKITIKNFIIANIASIAVLLFIFKLLLPSTLKFFAYLEIFFVNSIGLPFNSGTIIAGLLIIAFFYFSLNYTRKKNKVTANTLILCLLFVFIGFSSWLMLPIRANAQVIINENNPSDARELLAYYNLEQYPETHLFYGPQYTDIYLPGDENKPFVDDKKNYEKNVKTGKYEIINDWKNAKQNYNSKSGSLLPRMWSTEHTENYMRFGGLVDFKIKSGLQTEIYRSALNSGVSEEQAMNFASAQINQIQSMILDFKTKMSKGEIDYAGYHRFLKDYGASYFEIDKPSFVSNLQYMFQYQFGYMYWRYFMWNFTGRQNDIQGEFDDFNGNWLSGIPFIDKWHLGYSQENLPTETLNNKGRNTYYFLPFILGLLGFILLFNKDKNRFWVMLVFFLFTGLAIQFYTNVRPFEPRERDYSVVGSFYVFALWIGFGVYALYEFMSKYVRHRFVGALVGLVCLLAVPVVLASNNWDDHDRSNKYTTLAMARNYLESCASDAILFTIGDNDTFPLWYLQEIEGVRRDVRVVNTSLLQTDWYIDQMKRKAYESDPVPSQLTHNQYRYGTRDYLPYREINEKVSADTISIKKFLNFITSEDPKTKFKFILEQEGGDLSFYPSHLLKSNYYPTQNISIPVNKSEVLKSGLVKPKDADKIVDTINIKISSTLYKNRLMMLDIIANNNWERPIYFTGGAFSEEDYIWMKDYLQVDGLCYKLVPIATPIEKANPFEMGRIDTDLLFEKVTQWDWGNSGSDQIYHDVETRKNGITNRGILARLSEQLVAENKLDKAVQIADLAMEKMPVDKFAYYTLLEPFIQVYFKTNNEDKALALFDDVAKIYQEKLLFFSQMDIEKQSLYIDEIVTEIEKYRSLVDNVVLFGKEEKALEVSQQFNTYIDLFKHFFESPSKEAQEMDSLDGFLAEPDTILPENE